MNVRRASFPAERFQLQSFSSSKYKEVNGTPVSNVKLTDYIITSCTLKVKDKAHLNQSPGSKLLFKSVMRSAPGNSATLCRAHRAHQMFLPLERAALAGDPSRKHLSRQALRVAT